MLLFHITSRRALRPAHLLALLLILAALLILAGCTAAPAPAPAPPTPLAGTATPSPQPTPSPSPAPATLASETPTATPTPTALPASETVPGNFDPYAKKLDYAPYTLADIPLAGLQAQGLTLVAEQGITVTLIDRAGRLARLPFPDTIPSLRDSQLKLAYNAKDGSSLGYAIYRMLPELGPDGTPLPTAKPSSNTDPEPGEIPHYVLIKLPIPDGADLVVMAVSQGSYAGVMPGVPLAVALKADGEVLGAAPAAFMAGEQPALVVQTNEPTRLEQDGVPVNIGRGQSGWQIAPPPISPQRLAGIPAGSWQMEQQQPENGGPWRIIDLRSGSPLFVFDPLYKTWLPALDIHAPGVQPFDPTNLPALPGLSAPDGAASRSAGFPALHRYDATRQAIDAFVPAYTAVLSSSTAISGTAATSAAPVLFLNELGAVVARWEPAADPSAAGRLLALTFARGDVQIWSEMRNNDPHSFSGASSGPGGQLISRPVVVRFQMPSDAFVIQSELTDQVKDSVASTLSSAEQKLTVPSERLVAGFLHLAAISQYAVNRELPLNRVDLSDPELLDLVDQLQADWKTGQDVEFVTSDGPKPIQGFSIQVYDPSTPQKGSPVYLDRDGRLTISLPLLLTRQNWDNSSADFLGLAPALNNQMAEQIGRGYLQNMRTDSAHQYLAAYPWYGLLSGMKIMPLALWGEVTPDAPAP